MEISENRIKQVTVAAIQMQMCSDVKQNIKKADQMVRHGKAGRTDYFVAGIV